MDWIPGLTWIGGFASAAILLMLRAYLGARKEERRVRREMGLEDQHRRIATDRAIYGHRVTILVRMNLATFIRSGKWWTDEQDLRRLLLGLEQGAYEDFIDPDVNARWVRLIVKSVELAKKRLAGSIGRTTIRTYNRIYREWEDAAKRSFGPLPETAALAPRLNRDRRGDRRRSA